MNKVVEHYNAVADVWRSYYEEATHNEDVLYSMKEYPSPIFRLKLLTNILGDREEVNRILEVGVGEGTPLLNLHNQGYDVWGFDISDNMLNKARNLFKENGVGVGRLFKADIHNPMSYSWLLKDGKFDAIVAFGVMPHVKDDYTVVKNMSTLLNKDGVIIVEFRNKLFSLFTFNRYTVDFVVDDLLYNVGNKFKDKTMKELLNMLDIDDPPVRDKVEDTDAPGYDIIESKFHNPLNISSLFEQNGFKDIKLHWYHYHAGLPKFEWKYPEEFRGESIKLEYKKPDWRSYFLCSAFVVEGTKV